MGSSQRAVADPCSSDDAQRECAKTIAKPDPFVSVTLPLRSLDTNQSALAAPVNTSRLSCIGQRIQRQFEEVKATLFTVRDTHAFPAHIRRVAGFLATVGLIATITLVALDQPRRFFSMVDANPTMMILLFIVPVLGGGCAAIVLIVERRMQNDETEMDTRRLQKLLCVTDFFWKSSVTVALTSYVLLLLFPQVLPLSQHAALVVMFLTSYWMGATALSPVVLPMINRLLFFALIFLLLLTMPMRFGLPHLSSNAVDVLYVFCFNLPILFGISWVHACSDELDAITREQKRSQERLVEEKVRVVASRRRNEFVHDHLLSVLTAASFSTTNSAVLQCAAEETQSVMYGAREKISVTTVAGFAKSLQRRYPQIGVAFFPDAADFSLTIAADAIHGAVLEAVRNAFLHGGTTGRSVSDIEVIFRVHNDVLQIDICDNGVGFDEAEARKAGRFGIDHGIYGRMEEVGGAARIHSAVGVGTTVTLVWPAVTVADKRTEDPSSSWRGGLERALDTVAARLVVLAVVVAQAAIIYLRSSELTSVPLVIVAFLVYSVVALGLMARPWPDDRMPSWGAWLTVIVVGVFNYVALLAVPASDNPRTSTWSLGFGTLCACGLLLRRHVVAAWSVIAALLISTVVWALQVGTPLMVGLSLLVGQITTLMFWTAMVVWSARVVLKLTLADRSRMRAQEEIAVREGTRMQLVASLWEVSRRAAPLIETLASGEKLTDEMRVSARVLEAELRDEIRAASFTGTRVIGAARRARQRGVEVVLLDDSAEASMAPLVFDRFLAQVITTLDSAQGGRVVVRLLPPGSADIGTILSGNGRVSVSREQ